MKEEKNNNSTHTDTYVRTPAIQNGVLRFNFWREN